jgi:type I restriction enzyme S subunit
VLLKRTISKSIGGLWGDEPAGTADDVTVVRVADFDYPNLRVARASTNRAVPLRLRAERKLRPGDLLLEKSGGGDSTNVGRVVLWMGDHDAITSNFVNVLRPAPGFDSRFLVYLHRVLYRRGHAAAATKQTTGIQNLDIAAYLAVEVDVPVLRAQRRIASYLDRECARICALTQNVHGLRAQAVAAHWSRATPRLLDGDKSIRLKYLTGRPQNGSWGLEPNQSAHQLRCFRVTDFERSTLRLSGPGALRSFDTASASKLALRAGDLILEKSGGGPKAPVGFVVRCGDSAEGQTCSNFVARIRPSTDVDSDWLAFVFGALYALGRNRPFIKQVTGIQNLDAQAYLSLKVPHLPLEHQKAIAGRVQESLNIALAVSRDSSALLDALTEYRDSLITEAVTGQLDVTKLSESQMDEGLAAVREGQRSEVLSS